MPGVVNALAPRQGQDGVLKTPQCFALFPAPAPLAQERNDCMNVWWWVGGGRGWAQL